MNTPYLLAEIAVLVCACYAFVIIFRSIWHGVVVRAARVVADAWLDLLARLHARHQQSRREAWWDVGFNHAWDVVITTHWTTRNELMDNLREFRESRRP
jgi:hypothetical protein